MVRNSNAKRVTFENAAHATASEGKGSRTNLCKGRKTNNILLGLLHKIAVENAPQMTKLVATLSTVQLSKL